ncbi:MAG TPA: hypothetical protein G4O12_06245 [Dehalococcoidia bacterium]|nr:hypothetical protein [Dehalococcoidia bacterium]
MELLIAFGTDDRKNLNDDHVGMAKYFYVYKFSNNKQGLAERRKNVKLKGDESMKHGDPEKAKATSSVLEGVDAIVGRKFGPNLPRISKKFVCVVARMEGVNQAVTAVRDNIDLVIEQKKRGEDRRHIVLKL